MSAPQTDWQSTYLARFQKLRGVHGIHEAKAKAKAETLEEILCTIEFEDKDEQIRRLIAVVKFLAGYWEG